ncbi:MAG: acylphosphatase [Bacteroidales bacterium]|nr:acylphosphatase [Bacteroidales bacterium]
MVQKRYKITVSGRVQGVGYRQSSIKKANEYKLSGFVQNLPSGDVLIEAQGNDEKLNSFIRWCYDGPSWARVTNVEVLEQQPVKDDLGFRVIF